MGRRSLRLIQAFPRNINLGEGTERERGVISKLHIFESKFLKETG